MREPSTEELVAALQIVAGEDLDREGRDHEEKVPSDFEDLESLEALAPFDDQRIDQAWRRFEDHLEPASAPQAHRSEAHSQSRSIRAGWRRSIQKYPLAAIAATALLTFGASWTWLASRAPAGSGEVVFERLAFDPETLRGESEQTSTGTRIRLTASTQNLVLALSPPPALHHEIPARVAYELRRNQEVITSGIALRQDEGFFTLMIPRRHLFEGSSSVELRDLSNQGTLGTYFLTIEW